MPQQLYLFRSAPPEHSAELDEVDLDETLDDLDAAESTASPAELVESEFASDDLVEQTRALFHHHGSNAELVTQIMTAVHTLNELCAHPKAS